MQAEPTRHFVTLDGRWGTRQVHYRRAGSGPAVLLLHQSPQSSREMAGLMRLWAPHFTLVAPDTPGYGQSDPLGPPVLTIADLAAATLELADALDLGRFGIYGFHTGASIGLWLAHAQPGRVRALAAHGLAQLTVAEREDILRHYLPPVIPSWDGSHLAWLWARIREQTIFFPWYRHTADARMDFDMPPAEHLHEALMDMLRAGDHYAIAYRAAFESRPETILPALTTPLLVTAADGDPLQAHLSRLTALPATARAEPSASTGQVRERALHHLLAHAGDAAPPVPATRPVAGRLWNTMVRTGAGQIRVRLSLTGSAAPLLLLHDAGQSAEAAEHLCAQLTGAQPVALPDLPGHGESERPAPQEVSVDHCADVALETSHALGLGRPVLAGQGAGSLAALEAARRGPHRSRLALLDVPYLPPELRAAFRAHGMPGTEPQWHGGHLLLAWHMLRDGRLYFPWFERRGSNARRALPELEPARLQLELRELLKATGSWQNLLDDALDYPAAAALREVAADAVLGATRASAWHAATRAAAATAPASRFIDLPPESASWLPALLAGA